MERLLKLFLCTGIYFVVVVGCGSNKPAETTDWEPTNLQSVNDIDGVTLNFNQETLSATGGTIVLINETNNQYSYGEAFFLEQKIEGDWFQVPVDTENYGFNDIGYLLPPLGFEEIEVDWEWIYGKLAIGDYRLVKEVIDSRASGDYNQYDLAAEFTIE